MSLKMKTVCLSTILTLVMASGAVAIGFTSFVQAEIKDDLAEIKNQELIDREKISALQISNAEINGKLSLILEKLESKK
jgi:hypothetical protein